MTSRTAAEQLHAIYVEELRRALAPAEDAKASQRQIEGLITEAERIGPTTWTEPDATTWIWSDLHLGHEHSRSVFGRPFGTAAAADEAMMGVWEDEVSGNESIICLGDVTVDGKGSGTRLRRRRTVTSGRSARQSRTHGAQSARRWLRRWSGEELATENGSGS